MQAEADSTSINAAELALNAADAEAILDDVQATRTYIAALIPLNETYYTSIADAVATRDKAFVDVDAQYALSGRTAFSAAVRRWANTVGTPESGLEAALAEAATAKESVIIPAQATYDKARIDHAKAWVNEVAPAVTIYHIATADHDVTYANTVVPAANTLYDAYSNHALAANLAAIPLAVTLNNTLAGNITNWATTVVPVAVTVHTPGSSDGGF